MKMGMNDAPSLDRKADLPHILVVDDDDRIRALVSRYLNEHGFFALSAHDAAQAQQFLKLASFDALVVDVMMPGQTGLEFTKALREGSNIPIILLTALGEVDDRISGLESGADDYLPKPFDPRELVLRLQALLRRAPKPQAPDEPVQLGHWLFDPVHNEMRAGQDVLRLTEGEGALLKVMAARAGDVVSRQELAQLCAPEGGERTIDVQVARLRRKIEEDSKTPRILQTVRGKGYLLRLGGGA